MEMASIITKGSVNSNAKCMVVKNALDGWVFPLKPENSENFKQGRMIRTEISWEIDR